MEGLHVSFEFKDNFAGYPGSVITFFQSLTDLCLLTFRVSVESSAIILNRFAFVSSMAPLS
jgi:hypothetical protein